MLNSRMASYEIKTNRREVVKLYNAVVLGASGAVASQDSARDACFVVTQTDSETGRYTLTLAGIAARVLFVSAIILGVDDTAYTGGKGIPLMLRDNDIATDGTIELQMGEMHVAYADTLPEDSVTVLFEVTVALV